MHRSLHTKGDSVLHGSHLSSERICWKQQGGSVAAWHRRAQVRHGLLLSNYIQFLFEEKKMSPVPVLAHAACRGTA